MALTLTSKLGPYTFPDADGSFPAGFTNLNGATGEVRVLANKYYSPHGTAPGSVARVIDSGALLNTADHFFQATVSGFTGGNLNDGIGGGVRFGTGVQGGAGVTGYELRLIDSGGVRTTRWFKMVAGVETALGSAVSAAWAAGDILIGAAVGTTLYTLRNGVEIDTVTDSSIATGLPSLWAIAGGNNSVRGGPAEFGDAAIALAPSAVVIATIGL